jgi:hypothetical protein
MSVTQPAVTSAQDRTWPADTAEGALRGPSAVPVELNLNGTPHVVALEPRVSLLDAPDRRLR